MLEIPLLTTEEANTELANHYYPQVTTRYMPDLELKLGQIAEEFDALFSSLSWTPHFKWLLRHFYNKEMELIFCPHGQSDKGYAAPYLASYKDQDGVLIYGELMMEMLKDLNIPLQSYAIVGNYRRGFYQKHQSFYDALVEKEIFSKLSLKKRTLLYAPTWQDADGNSSFFNFGAKVIDELPSDWNLILKLHPQLEESDPLKFYTILNLMEKKPNGILVSSFPPIYPILERVDVYLGDFSSVGYDFLSQKKAMFFLPTKQVGRLHSCGSFLDPSKKIYPQLEAPNEKRALQEALYARAYSLKEGNMKTVWSSLRRFEMGRTSIS